MRKGFVLVLMVTILFGGGYFYYIAQAVCPTPISYSIGAIDERFNISRDEVRVIVSEAESVWEDATGRNLFSYEDGGKLAVNFVYDDRQEFVEAEETMKEKLDATENMSEAIKNTYTELVKRYSELKLTYQENVRVYEQKLNAYNAEVEKYNNEGGAPADAYASLSKQKKALDAEQKSLNALSTQLNTLVKQINDIGEKGNSLVQTYNKGVNFYNQSFGDAREFTQGDYSNNTIKIYTFENRAELKQVLVHELGHALSLGHVEGTDSEMYYLIGEQASDSALTEADLQEFNRVCGEKSLLEQLQFAFKMVSE